MRLLASLLVLVAALAMTGARAFELCDVEGRSGEFYSSLLPLDKVSQEGDLEEMDTGLNALLAAHEAGRISDALVHRVFQGFATGWGGLEPRLREWIHEYPRSHAAHLALAYHYTGQGWAARGSRPARATSPDQLAQARRHFRRALKAYDAADALGKKPTLSIAQRIFIAAAGTPGLDANRLYREAIRKYPDTLQVRIRYIDASRPDWGGSVQRLESIIEDAKALPAADRRYVEYLVYQEIGVAYWCAEREGCVKAQDRKGENATLVVGYLEKSIPLCPGLDRALERLITYRSEMHDFAGAIDAATLLIERKPRSAWAFDRRGSAYSKTGRYEDSFADYERAAALGDYAAFKELAWFYESGTAVAKDVAKAIDLYLIADAHRIEGARAGVERLSKESGVPIK